MEQRLEQIKHTNVLSKKSKIKGNRKDDKWIKRVKYRFGSCKG